MFKVFSFVLFCFMLSDLYVRNTGLVAAWIGGGREISEEKVSIHQGRGKESLQLRVDALGMGSFDNYLRALPICFL